MNDFVNNNNTQVGVVEAEIVGTQNNVLVDNLGCETLGEDSESHNQVIEGNIANRVRKEVENP